MKKIVMMVPILLMSTSCSEANFRSFNTSPRAEKQPEKKIEPLPEQPSKPISFGQGETIDPLTSPAQEQPKVDLGESEGQSEGSISEILAERGRSAACQSTEPLEMKASLNFPRTSGTSCPSGNGNATRKNGSNMMARRIQEAKIELPAGAAICNFKLASKTENIRYDDELLVVFEGFFVGGANHTEQRMRQLKMPTEGDLIKYTWERHIRTKSDQMTGGCMAGISECVFPPSDKMGPLRLSFDSTWLDKLPKEVQSQNEFTLELIVAGNLNSNSDCTHTGIEFEATIHYVR